MTQLFAFVVVVSAMLAPYVLVALLTAAFPSLTRRFGQGPSTDQLVARFFDGESSRSSGE